MHMTGGNAKLQFRTLPIVLLAAVVQGWSLYGLHIAVKQSHWPATAPSWLLGLYAIALFIPLTVQLMAQHVAARPAAVIVGCMAVLFFYFGWQHGAGAVIDTAGWFLDGDGWIPLALACAVLWLLIMPFAQSRLAQGTWRVSYASLFATAWRNKLVLAEAGLFTGLFWLLLLLWQQLFHMIGIDFFRELFKEPVFIYPVTSLVFGIALHLIGSIERMIDVVLEQLLNVLKWLALVAGLILALFAIALVFKLPQMIGSGERAISAAWLLWLVAVTVLLVNAAYRDGQSQQPYPWPIGLALRCVVPLICIIAATAIYALYIRTSNYGFTIERVWGSIVAAVACIYAVGYAWAALRPGKWMAEVARVNVVAALFLIAVISLALTPLLSPYRIAANSQFTFAQEPSRPSNRENLRAQTPMHYLRFDAGDYGLKRLRELAALQDHPRAADIRAAASAMLARKDKWGPPTVSNAAQLLAAMAIYPAGAAVSPALLRSLESDMTNGRVLVANDEGMPLGGAFVDLNADQVDEFALLVSQRVHLYQQQADDSWRRVGIMNTRTAQPVGDVIAALRSGDISVRESTWRELLIGGHAFRLIMEERAVSR